MICLKCGCESPEGARFCKKCGADLNGQTEETSFTASSGMANTDGAPGYEKDETRHEMEKAHDLAARTDRGDPFVHARFEQYGFSEEEMIYWAKQIRMYTSAEGVEELLDSNFTSD